MTSTMGSNSSMIWSGVTSLREQWSGQEKSSSSSSSSYASRTPRSSDATRHMQMSARPAHDLSSVLLSWNEHHVGELRPFHRGLRTRAPPPLPRSSSRSRRSSASSAASLPCQSKRVTETDHLTISHSVMPSPMSASRNGFLTSASQERDEANARARVTWTCGRAGERHGVSASARIRRASIGLEREGGERMEGEERGERAGESDQRRPRGSPAVGPQDLSTTVTAHWPPAHIQTHVMLANA